MAKPTEQMRGSARAMFAWVLLALPIVVYAQVIERRQDEVARALILERQGVAALRASFSMCDEARPASLRTIAERSGLVDDADASLTRRLDAVVQRWPSGCARLRAATTRLLLSGGRDRAAYAQRASAITEEATGQAILVAGAEDVAAGGGERGAQDAQRIAGDVSAYVRAVNGSLRPGVDRERSLRLVARRDRTVLADTTLAARHAVDAMDADLLRRIALVNGARRLTIGFALGGVTLMGIAVALAFRLVRRRGRELLADARSRVDRLSADLARALALNALAVSETQFRALFDGTTTGVALLDRSGTIIKQNQALSTVLQSSERSDLGTDRADFAALWDGVRDTIAYEMDVADRAGGRRCLEMNLSVIRGEDGTALYVMLLARDITDRKLTDRRLLHQATHDSLTALPNRTLFFDRLSAHVAESGADDATSAVFFIDLDDFKSVNDAIGHEWGDAVLVAAAQRLRAELPEHLVARLGGDEFGVLLRGCGSRADVERLARLLVAAFLPPLMIEGREVFVTVTIGVAFCEPATTQTASMLVRDADIAMYHAKRSGRARYAIFDTDMREAVVRQSVVVSEMRKALERDDFFVVYQPIVDLSNRSIGGFEALARWRHGQLGNIPPSEFIAVAEQTGMIVALGEFVLRDACNLVARWQTDASGPAPCRVNVNISPTQLLTLGFPERATEIVHQSGLDPSSFTLELTESGLLAHGEASSDALARIKRAGFGLSLDDFGTGYSSLGYLQRFPFDELKIDRCFVSGSGGALTNPPIISMVVALARSLGIAVIAEGVETAEQADKLHELGCTRGQGFYFGGPRAAARPGAFLALP